MICSKPRHRLISHSWKIGKMQPPRNSKQRKKNTEKTSGKYNLRKVKSRENSKRINKFPLKSWISRNFKRRKKSKMMNNKSIKRRKALTNQNQTTNNPPKNSQSKKVSN
jgi:hypothetical protein